MKKVIWHFILIKFIEPALLIAVKSGFFEIVKEFCKIKTLNINAINIVLFYSFIVKTLLFI